MGGGAAAKKRQKLWIGFIGKDRIRNEYIRPSVGMKDQAISTRIGKQCDETRCGGPS